MRRTLALTFLLLTMLCHVSAQEQKTFSPKEFLLQQEKFITKEAQLNSNEAAGFFPLFHEMNNQLRNKDKQIRELMWKVRTEQLNEAQYKEILQKLDHFALEKVKIEMSYHKKFLTVLSAEKVVKVMDANRHFDRQLLKRMINREHAPRGKGKQ